MPLGTNVFQIAMNLASSEHQPALIQQIKSQGGDVIQTSSGLCVKTSLAESEFQKLVDDVAGVSLKIEKIDGATDKSKLSADVQAFLS